jgi:putative inorganic carbon (hco3(-)) transporter
VRLPVTPRQHLAAPAFCAVLGMLAVACGALAGAKPMLGLGVVFGIAFVGLVLVDLTLGVYAFGAAIYVEAIPEIERAVSLTKMMGLALALAWLAAAIRRKADRRALTADHPRIVGLMVLFVAWAWLSTLWAEDAGVVPGTVLRFALNFSLLAIVYAALRTPRNAQILIVCMIAGAVLSAAIGFLNPAASTSADAGRLTGAGVNSNQLGLFMVGSAVLAATLAMIRGFSGVTRLLLAAAAVICMLALLKTGSREALLGFLVALIVGTAFAGRGRRALAMLLTSVAILSAGVYIAVFAPPDIRERVTQLDGGSGREDIWRVGARMVRANPVLGVGAGNFIVSSKHYLLQPGVVRRADYIIDEPKEAHNIYLNVLAELGVVGLGAFLAIVASMLACGVLAARTFAQRRDASMELLSRGVCAALCGVLAGSFFSSQLYSKPLWLILALCPALLAIARDPRKSRQVA